MQEETKDSIKIPVANFKEIMLAATKIGESNYKQRKKRSQRNLFGNKNKFSSPKKKSQNRPPPKWDVRTSRRNAGTTEAQAQAAFLQVRHKA